MVCWFSCAVCCGLAGCRLYVSLCFVRFVWMGGIVAAVVSILVVCCMMCVTLFLNLLFSCVFKCVAHCCLDCWLLGV